jgi:hypothetical protein
VASPCDGGLDPRGWRERRSPKGAVDGEVHSGGVEDDGGSDSRSSAVME